MGTALRAIPTAYKGTQFKSRMEAQCAFMFDLCGWAWTYETESVMLSNGRAFLLDFDVANHKYAVECRGYSTEHGNAQIMGFSRSFPDLGFLKFVVIGPDEGYVFDGSPQPVLVSLQFCHGCRRWQFTDDAIQPSCDECEDSQTDEWTLEAKDGKVLLNGQTSEYWPGMFAEMVECAG